MRIKNEFKFRNLKILGNVIRSVFPCISTGVEFRAKRFVSTLVSLYMALHCYNIGLQHVNDNCHCNPICSIIFRLHVIMSGCVCIGH